MWGIFPEPRLLPGHARYTRRPNQAAPVPRWPVFSGPSRCEAAPGRHSADATPAWSTDAFLQDGFQITRNTTVEMGLRYE